MCCRHKKKTTCPLALVLVLVLGLGSCVRLLGKAYPLQKSGRRTAGSSYISTLEWVS